MCRNPCLCHNSSAEYQVLGTRPGLFSLALSLQAEYRSIIFALCYFHAALLERKKFGVGNLPAATSGIGWNMNYPFNTGDLLCCGQCASNYLENNVKVCAAILTSSCCEQQRAQ